MLLTSVTFLRAITMCSAFTPDCGYNNSTIILRGTCMVQKRSIRVNFACTKRLFNLSAELIINARNAHLCVRCKLFFSQIKQIPFSCRLVNGFTFLKRIENQFKLLLEMCIVLTSIVSTDRNAILLVVI